MAKTRHPDHPASASVHPFPIDASSAPRAAEAQDSPQLGQVIDFPGRPDEPQAGDGDGGDGTEIVIRIVVDWPDVPEDPPDEPEPEPERKGRLGPFLWGALIGWWLGG
jgi:hypothetical protein